MLWLGAEELGAMTLMWARMERRLERRHRQNEEMLRDTDTFVHSVMMRSHPQVGTPLVGDQTVD